MLSSLQNLMESMSWPAEQALDALKIEPADRVRYLEALANQR